MCAAVGPHDAAVVVASCDDPELSARLRRILDTVTAPGAYVAMAKPAEPADGEMAVAVIGPDGTEAVCLRAAEGRIAGTGDLATVAAIARVLFQRLA